MAVPTRLAMFVACRDAAHDERGMTMEQTLDPGQGIAEGGCYPAEEAEGHDLPDILDDHGYDLPDVDDIIDDHGYDLPDLDPHGEPLEDWCGTEMDMDFIDL